VDSEKDYEVGYGRPPDCTRFKRGVSGNPKGRPRKSRQIDDLVDRELDQKIPVTENGKTRKISKRELLAKQRIRLALGGDRHALSWAFEFMRTRSKPTMFEIDSEDEKALQSMVASMPKEAEHGPDITCS